MANGGVIENGVKLVGEIVVPGASLLLDGEIKAGIGHAAVGLVTWGLLGPARLLVSANSFSKSVTDQHLHTHLLDSLNSMKNSVSKGVAGLRATRASATNGTGPADVASAPAEATAAPA
jgi:hypothetical protein